MQIDVTPMLSVLQRAELTTVSVNQVSKVMDSTAKVSGHMNSISTSHL